MPEQRRPNPWPRFRAIFLLFGLIAMTAPAMLFIALGLPDEAAWLVIGPGWAVGLPVAAWGAARVTEWTYARSEAPVFDWDAVWREVLMVPETIGSAIAGLIVLAVGLAVLAGLVALVVTFAVPLAILVGAVIIAAAMPR